jgi:hypothetical protein
MANCRSSLENIGKMSLISVFQQKFTTGSTKPEFDVLDSHKKLVKYVVHYPKEKIEKKIFFFT